MMARNVAVWRESWLPGSETFIRNQIDSFTAWSAIPIALEQLDSPISGGARIVFGADLTGRVQRKMFRATGRSAVVAGAIAQANPDLIHAHFATDGGRLVPIARRLDIPLVVTVHGYDLTATERLSRNERLWVRSCMREATRVIALSQFMAERAAEWGADASRVTILPTGIPLRPRSISAKEPTDVVDVIFVGRLVEKKGAHDAIEAVRRICAKGTSVRLTIIGAGSLRRDLEAQATPLGDSVRFLGALPPAAVRMALSHASIFLGPSKRARDGDSEGLGMVFLEAAAHGLPSVAYRHGGVPDSVVHGSTGLLAPEGNLDQLTEHLEMLVKDHSMRSRLGAQARSYVETSHDVTVQTRKLERLYDEVWEEG